jgi:hypothetical protein
MYFVLPLLVLCWIPNNKRKALTMMTMSGQWLLNPLYFLGVHVFYFACFVLRWFLNNKRKALPMMTMFSQWLLNTLYKLGVQVFCFVLLVLFCVGFQITKERCSQ